MPNLTVRLIPSNDHLAWSFHPQRVFVMRRTLAQARRSTTTRPAPKLTQSRDDHLTPDQDRLISGTQMNRKSIFPPVVVNMPLHGIHKESWARVKIPIQLQFCLHFSLLHLHWTFGFAVLAGLLATPHTHYLSLPRFQQVSCVLHSYQVYLYLICQHISTPRLPHTTLLLPTFLPMRILAPTM